MTTTRQFSCITLALLALVGRPLHFLPSFYTRGFPDDLSSSVHSRCLDLLRRVVCDDASGEASAHGPVSMPNTAPCDGYIFPIR